MNIKIDKADKLFSQYVRLRDRECKRCHSLVELNAKGMPISHQASHYFGRGHENTRFEPDNVDTLCMPCHRRWGSDDKEDYRVFKIKQLGEKRFATLQLQANTFHKKDRKMEVLKWQLALKGVIKFILVVLFLSLSVGSVHASILEDVNAVRVTNHARALVQDKRLDASATIKACDMSSNNYFAHKDLKGRFSWHLILEQKYYYTYAGEDLGRAYSDNEVVSAFMASPSHKTILLDKRYEDIGIGKCGIYTVLHFGI